MRGSPPPPGSAWAGYLIAPEDVRATLALYLDRAQLTDTRASPVLFADRDLRPLPRTLLLVAELDPKIDDGEAIAPGCVERR
jgi:acetyl esterase/lipase